MQRRSLSTGANRYEGRGLDLVAFALALIDATRVEEVLSRALKALHDSRCAAAWAILERTGPGAYRATVTGALCPAGVRALAERAVSDGVRVVVRGGADDASDLGAPVWSTPPHQGSGRQREPELIVAAWPEEDELTPGFLRPPLTRAVQLLNWALRSTRVLEYLLEQTSRDPLTGILNRRGILDALEREKARARRYGRPLAVLFLDMNRFKAINDRFGHPAGDEVLAIAARRIAESLRACDQIGRIGGDEFLVVLPDTDLKAARRIARRIASEVATQPIVTAAGRMRLGVTIGAAGLEDDPTGDALLERADHRMLQRKQRRRRRAGSTGVGSPVTAAACSPAGSER